MKTLVCFGKGKDGQQSHSMGHLLKQFLQWSHSPDLGNHHLRELRSRFVKDQLHVCRSHNVGKRIAHNVETSGNEQWHVNYAELIAPSDAVNGHSLP